MKTASLRGVGRIAIAAVEGVTRIVEEMHRNIAGAAPVFGSAPPGGARGVSGLVYRSVRGTTRAVGQGLDAALARFGPLLGAVREPQGGAAALAALNGVLGDYLEASGNPLAIKMSLRHEGRPLDLERGALAARFPRAGGKVVVLVHGLCMNDIQWRRAGHDHGAALAADLGCTALYLHYNSGRHVAVNGAEFSMLLDALVEQWPGGVSELVIVGHSMGGLVARSACEVARGGRGARRPWLRRLAALVFVGTPHHGAPLERAGGWIDLLLGISPYTAPFARLGAIRSAGVKDLRHGDLRGAGESGLPPRLPARVPCYAIAATSRAQPGAAPASTNRLPGDGLVPVNSALGRHRDPALVLPFPASHQAIAYGLNHFDLLSDAAVYERIRSWLAQGRIRKPRTPRGAAPGV